MPEKDLPARPNLEQYKKQAKDLARDFGLGAADALARARRHHPRFYNLADADVVRLRIKLTDAQLVIAREHGFESWPKFSGHIESMNIAQSVANLSDPASAFIEAGGVPRDASHASGTLERADMILAHYPQVANANIYAAAMVADEAGVRKFLARDTTNATIAGGPYGWDALTHLCFSRYLRIDRARSAAFVRTARALLDAGANANTGWYEKTDHPKGHVEYESAIYGAAGVAQHAEMTRLLLEYGADPNDGETPYHAAEGYDLAVLNVLVESGKLNSESLNTLLLRKADWHDLEGMRLLLEHGADPNAMTRWGQTALHQAVRRDNRLEIIELLLDHGADPAVKSVHGGRSATAMAARKGRGDVLAVMKQRGIDLKLEGVDVLIAACAMADHGAILALTEDQPQLVAELVAEGGTLLAEFAGNGNTEGVRCLLDVGVDAGALFKESDIYFDIAEGGTALHAAAWRAWPETVKLLVERGAPVNAIDGKGRSALALAVRACVDSYWTDRRSPDSVEALLKAGASLDGIEFPCGYDEVDMLISRYTGNNRR